MVQRQEQEPASVEVTEVAPDILRLQLPIALPGLGHVNTYALCDDRGVAVVDPGLPGKASYRALVDRLATAGYGVRDVHTVIVTHSHPDHFGGAGILRHEAGADVVTHRAFRTWLDPDEGDEVGPDELDAVVAAGGESPEAAPTGSAAARSPWGRQMPWNGETFKPPLKRRMGMQVARRLGKRWMRAPEPSVRLDANDVVTYAGREWVAMHTPGHTEDHLCLYSPADGVLLSGDHVLPTITPHISGLAAEGDPLSAFFASLDAVAALDGATLGLPAHGHPFDDIAGRCTEIRDHHHQRLQTLRDAADAIGEGDVEEYSRHLFKPRSWGQMAQSETFAHLQHLERTGEMAVRRDGDVLRFARTPD